MMASRGAKVLLRCEIKASSRARSLLEKVVYCSSFRARGLRISALGVVAKPT
jgi:hypothetical protein